MVKEGHKLVLIQNSTIMVFESIDTDVLSSFLADTGKKWPVFI